LTTIKAVCTENFIHVDDVPEMIGLLCFAAAVFSAFKSKIWLEAENATLRHQLVALRRKLKDRCLGNVR
jgi:hypothetical protein